MPAIRVNPPSNAAAEIETLAATGFSMKGLAAHFRCSVDTIRNWFEKHSALKQAFENGREKERLALHNALYKKAMNGDGPAAMFLLKSKHGYREGDQKEESNRVAITFNLPGALKPEQYGSMVTLDANTSSEAKPIPRITASRS